MLLKTRMVAPVVEMEYTATCIEPKVGDVDVEYIPGITCGVDGYVNGNVTVKSL